MSAQVLAGGVLGLFTAGGFLVVSSAGDPGTAPASKIRAYDGQVVKATGAAAAPVTFVAVNQQIPNVTSRSLARTRQAHACRVRVTCTAPTAGGVRMRAQETIDALEGKRPTAAGWSTSPLALINAREPVEDREVAAPTGGRYPMFAVLEFEYTATLR